MNRLENMSKPLVWSTALLLTAIVAGCGGSTGAAGTPGAQGIPGLNGLPGASGVPGTPAPGTSPSAVNLLSASTYALTTSAGFTATLGSASAASNVNNATFGGNVAMDAPTQTCISTTAATGTNLDSCGLVIATSGVPATLDVTNAAVNTTGGGLKVTGTTIRYSSLNSARFNATVRAVKNDVNAAWQSAFNQPTVLPPIGTLDGLILPPGVYYSASTMLLGAAPGSGGGTLTLDAGAGNANAATAVWIFKVGSSLTVNGSTLACSTATPPVCTPTQVVLKNGALAKNVFWEVGTPRATGTNPPGAAPNGGAVSFSEATGGAGNQTIFAGTILAGGTVSLAGGVAITGRILAGADLLDGTTPGVNSQTDGKVTTTLASGNSGPITITLPL